MMPSNLLTDPLFSVQTNTGVRQCDLPGLLEALGADDVQSLPALQRHQEDAFHIFLCYLAASVLLGVESADPTHDAHFWREGIRRLTTSEGCPDDSAWMLVVPDWSKPAFMQPPTDDAAAYSRKALTPDALDLLPTAKNHDMKSSRLLAYEPQDWAFALVSLQTMDGYHGSGNHGIARMNGGYGSRAVASLISSTTSGGHFTEDVRRLLSLHDRLLRGPWGYSEGGTHLLWLPPWDGKSSMAVSQLAPFFIEICRRVRLVTEASSLEAWGASSAAPRLAAKELNGVLGDPWIPIKLEGRKGETALTVGPSGISARLVRDLLFEDGYRAAPMMRPGELPDHVSADFTLSVLVRGQGTTEGLQEARVRIPGKVRSRLFSPGASRDHLADLSRQGLEKAALMEGRVLKPAVLSLLESGAQSAEIDWDRDQVVRWWDKTRRAFVSAWSAEFFAWLFRSAQDAEIEAEAALAAWARSLTKEALRGFEQAVTSFPHRQARSFRSQAMAERILIQKLYYNFPELKEVSDDPTLTEHADS